MVKKPRLPKSRPLLADDRVSIQTRPLKPRDPAQPHLPFDPMPDRIEPCLAKLASKPPQGDEWAYEIKWDGYRLAVHVTPMGIRIITRGGHDWTHRFPGIAASAKELGGISMILDGEAVVLDNQGRSDFGRLQNSLGGRGGKLPAGNAILYAFDLLYLDGHDLTGMELSARRHLLEDVLHGHEGGGIRLSEEIEAEPEALLERACELGLEGIIAKRLDRPYRSGRLGDWLKIKCIQSDSFVIIGYEPSTSMPGSFASLFLAAIKGDGLVYVGNVGTGFKHDAARKLRRQLDAIRIDKPVVPLKGKKVVPVSPELVVEVEYRAWTHTGTLRHASFKELREEADSSEVFEIK